MDYKSQSAPEMGLFHAPEQKHARRPLHQVSKILIRPSSEFHGLRLADVIAKEIVPRLQTYHHDITSAQSSTESPRASEIAEFSALIMGPDVDQATAYFQEMRNRGHSLDNLFVHFLEPTARHLGELWEQDRVDFLDVTIGVGHLRELLSTFGTTENVPVRDAHFRALLITTPGEKHMFGLDMVGQYMRSAGWDVATEPCRTAKESAASASHSWFGVVGLTLSSDAGLEAAARVIQAVKRASANAYVSVMVGGPVFTKDPALAVQIGADAVAVDAQTAVVLAKKLLLRQPAD
jgi:methanogenic corrinoid protein MtbC1